MSDGGVPDLATLTQKVRELNRVIRNIEERLIREGDLAADAEAAYRSQYAHKLREQREAGATVAEAEAYARAAVVVLSRDRDAKAHRVKVTFEEIEDRRQEKVSLHALINAIGGPS